MKNMQKNVKRSDVKGSKKPRYSKEQIFLNRVLCASILLSVIAIVIAISSANKSQKVVDLINERTEIFESNDNSQFEIPSIEEREENAKEDIENIPVQFVSDYDSRADHNYMITSKEEFIRALKNAGCFSENEVYFAYPEAFLKAQDETGVSVVFITAVCKIESAGGTAWELIDKKSNNIFSIKSSSSGWQSYDSIDDAVMAFAKLISGSDYYWKNNNYKVSEISKVYCEEGHWSSSVNSFMESIYEGLERR